MMANHLSRACRFVAGWAAVTPALVGCRQESYTPLCRVTKLANQDASAVDKMLGSPANVIQIPGSPSQRAGEYRVYALSTGARVRVRFFAGKAMSFAFSLRPPAQSPDAALRAVGLDAHALAVTDHQDTFRTWRGSVEGIAFDSVTASTSQGGQSSWNSVEVAVKGSPD